MPYKSEKIKIEHTGKDRRIKLSDSDKIDIFNSIGVGIRELARKYGVDKRLIQFIKYPERYEKNKQLRKERGGSKAYYTKEKQREYMKNHRHYKQDLYLKGEIK